ncbi:CBS domain-containing protein [Streptomyces sp. N35]|uniref:CBS domain-containing protein n=1 Tax=Streptomyces sp. N35 TaxID=2795730 RepID=UPI0018F2BE18|nr:CBS domain-containing protein [Streptomyces sp. N35]
MRAWTVRAGRDGEREQAALDDGLIIAGWPGSGDLTEATTRDEIRAVVQDSYPHEGPRVVANWTGQLLRFRQEIQIGDLVVLPLRSWQLAVGRVTGDYAYRADAEDGLRHVRAVEWLVKDLDRAAVQQDLLDSMGSLLTVFELSRFNAAERVAALAQTGTDPGRPDPAISVATPDKLAAAVAARPANQPLKISIRDFLSVWNAPRRYSSVIDEIQTDLLRLGLVTSPSFTEGTIDSEITVLSDGEEPDDEGSSSLMRSGVQVLGEPELPPVAYRISNLPAAHQALASVRVGDSLRSATTKMILNHYSQLPVLDADDRLRGVVSWETIGMARLADPDAQLDAATKPAREADSNDDLLNWIGEIRQSGYVFVRDPDLKVTGIITAADLTVQFGARVRPFILLEEIEQRLRRAADAHFTVIELRAHVPRSRRDTVMSAAGLTLGAYGYLLKEEEHWKRLGWDVDHQLFLEWLEECRIFRNNLMHFSPDPLTEEQLRPVEGLLQLLRSLDPRP